MIITLQTDVFEEIKTHLDKAVNKESLGRIYHFKKDKRGSYPKAEIHEDIYIIANEEELFSSEIYKFGVDMKGLAKILKANFICNGWNANVFLAGSDSFPTPAFDLKKVLGKRYNVCGLKGKFDLEILLNGIPEWEVVILKSHSRRNWRLT